MPAVPGMHPCNEPGSNRLADVYVVSSEADAAACFGSLLCKDINPYFKVRSPLAVLFLEVLEVDFATRHKPFGLN